MNSKEKKNKTTDNESDNITTNNSDGCNNNESNKNEEQEPTANMTDESFESGDKEESLAEEVAMWQDKYLRLTAEFDNFRKRTLKEKMELIDNAGEEVIKSILTIVDDFDRAALAMDKTDDIESIKSGIKLIHKRLIDVLKHKGVSEIEAHGKELDTDYHDAIAKVPTNDDNNKGKIIDVVEKGYKMKDKVIRYSKVVVGE